MKIILLREKGRSRAFPISRRAALGASCALLACAAFLVHLLVAELGRDSLPPQTVAEWRERLSEQSQQVEQMRERSVAESEAVGRRLAQMQARLLRMEALGARVTEVADLDEGEFSFDAPAPQGGPSSARQTPRPTDVDWEALNASLDELAAGIRARENELEVLESMLRDRDYREAKAIAGRPVTWGWLSSKYGKRVDPFTGRMAFHAGVDFAGKAGSDIITVASGVVTHAGKRYGYGLMVEVTHGDGYVTRYGHQSELLVQAGEIVKKGQVIGRMGSSGRSTGPHVHFEVLKNGRHVDPARYVARAR